MILSLVFAFLLTRRPVIQMDMSCSRLQNSEGAKIDLLGLKRKEQTENGIYQ